MKRLLLPVVMVICLLPMHGAVVHRSNSIGQSKGPWDDGAEYRLIENGAQRQLYKDENLVWTAQRFEDPHYSLEVFKPADQSPELISIYRDGFLSEERLGDQTIYYELDEDGRLIRKTTVVGNVLSEVKFFGYSDTTLITVLTVKPGQVLLSTFGHNKEIRFSFHQLDQEGELFTTYPNDLTFHMSWSGSTTQEQLNVLSFDEQGLVLKRTMQNGSEQTERYDARGLLVSVESPFTRTDYLYNEGRKLIEERSVEGEGRLTVKTYRDGVLATQQTWLKEEQVSMDVYHEDGSRKQTVYIAGEPYADITYAPDGRRVLSISYR